MASGLMNPFFLVEREILKNTNARGDLSKLSKSGDLEKIVSYLARMKKSVNNEKCLIVTGFPCVEATLVNQLHNRRDITTFGVPITIFGVYFYWKAVKISTDNPL